ncbi:MAG: AAA family ATPase, partial [Myxococcales bacterium]|nr:AAA family ATPase [Myxococcales bacterium]
MKLHRVTIENLGSLYGSHELDLDNDLGGAPLFVIVGPTGAGKSTVLDAVSLALFGETPRLTSGRARNRGDDDDVRHIMSRGAGECRAVLELSRRVEGGGRARYRATWYCHRAGTRADGAFQTPRRGLERWSEARGVWEVLADDQRKKVYEPAFAEALDGLTVEDFQRSMLLPQGEFAALLEAPPEAKAAILERLTNTSVYLDVGQRANQRRIAAQRELERLAAQLEGVARLAPEEAASLVRTLEASRGRLDQARRHARTLEGEVGWLARADALAAQEEHAAAEADLARAAIEDAATELGRLAEDARCRPAAGRLAALREATAREAAATARVA